MDVTSRAEARIEAWNAVNLAAFLLEFDAANDLVRFKCGALYIAVNHAGTPVGVQTSLLLYY